ncbi:MAG TPA: WbqC family protein [Polyangiaceae bacterium]|nr:WbqC family protein [Polyangiaceae bacterium]
MRLAIMQPYFFPYAGYFQLIAAVDRFVVYDDVAFIKNGWINRNRILGSNGPEYFTVPLAGASSFRPIRETRCAPAKLWRDKMLKTLQQVYARAPERDAGMGLVERVLNAADGGSIRDLAVFSLREVCHYAELAPSWQETSTAYENAELSGVERVLDICRRERATTYLNAPGGRALYDSARFEAEKVRLLFLAPVLEPYAQSRGKTFVPGLSVVDMLMNLPRAELSRRLRAGLEVS